MTYPKSSDIIDEIFKGTDEESAMKRHVQRSGVLVKVVDVFISV